MRNVRRSSRKATREQLDEGHDWARVLDVSLHRHGRPLAAAAAIGDQTLDFGQRGAIFGGRGWIQAGTQVAQHTGWDEDTGLLTLVDELTVELDEGDRVLVWDRSRGTVATDLRVMVDRDDDQQAPLPVVAGPQFFRTLPVGQRDDGDGEIVRIEFAADEDEWRVIDVVDQADTSSPKFCGTDVHALTTAEVDAGVFVKQLSHGNVVEDLALVVNVNGVTLGTDWWALDDAAGIVTVTVPAWLAEAPESAREFGFEYWWLTGPTLLPPEEEPVTPTWRLACKIADYEDTSGTYHYPSGPLTGNTSMPFNGFNGDYQCTVDYSELGGATFADLGIVGWKIVARCTGDPGSSGHVGFVINLDNPHYPSAPQWPDGGASGGGITIDSYWGDGVQGSIPVTAGVTEVFEHELAVNSTASDPYYEGFNYNDMLGKLEVSLKSTYGGFPHLVVEVEGNGLVGACTVEQFDIVLIGTP